MHWPVATQVAQWVAGGGPGVALPGVEVSGAPEPEPVIGPAERARLAEVAAAAEAHVMADTGEPAPTAGLDLLGRAEWAERALTQLRPVLERLATTLQGQSGFPGGARAEPPEEGGPDPLGPMLDTLGPLLLGVQCGFMVGQLAQGLRSQHDLLLPTAEAARPAVIVPNLEAFAAAWSIPPDDLRFHTGLSEAVRSRMCSRRWIRDRLTRLAGEYVSSFRIDPDALQSELGSLDLSDPSSFEGLLSNPDAVLVAMSSPAQEAVLERLRLTTAVLESYADLVVDRLAGPLVPSLGVIREASRRHRLERSEADRFVQRLLGLDPSGRTQDTAGAFCAGVVERAGAGGLAPLLEGEEFLPTPSELEAPGLWLARLELDR